MEPRPAECPRGDVLCQSFHSPRFEKAGIFNFRGLRLPDGTKKLGKGDVDLPYIAVCSDSYLLSMQSHAS